MNTEPIDSERFDRAPMQAAWFIGTFIAGVIAGAVIAIIA